MSDNVAEFQPADNDAQGDVQEAETKDVGGVAGSRLKSFIERIERLEEEKSSVVEDIKETYAEAKGVGFDPKTIRKVIKIKNMDAEKRQEEEALLDLYKTAIGLL